MLLLAQTAEAADKAIGMAERLNAGGVPVLSIVVAMLAIIGLLVVAREWRNEVKAHRKTVEDQGKDTKKDADTNLDQQKGLMREMLVRDKEAIAANHALATALGGQTDAIKDTNARIQDTHARVLDLERNVSPQLAAVDRRLAELERLVRDSLSRPRTP